MSEDLADLREMAESVFGDAWDAEASGFDEPLWAVCEETGLARLTLPEAAGGSGASWSEAATVLTAAGRFAARLPLVETGLAGWLADVAGLPVPGSGPLGVGLAPDLRVDGDTATGTVPRVGWAGTAAAVVVLTSDRVLVVDPAAATLAAGTNLAEEPRDDVVLDGAPVAVAPVGPEVVEEYRLRAALGRSCLLAGAAHGALSAAVRYATERVQFGRPIAKLQAVQQMLALAGAEVAAATAAAQGAARDADTSGILGATTAIAVAKARGGEAAGEVARIAHQALGAIGFTREHDLRLATTRLWAWRDEDGAEAFWQDLLGAQALLVGTGPADPHGLWDLVRCAARP